MDCSIKSFNKTTTPTRPTQPTTTPSTIQSPPKNHWYLQYLVLLRVTNPAIKSPQSKWLSFQWRTYRIRMPGSFGSMGYVTTPLRINIEPENDSSWFSSSAGVFSGSMLIFWGVYFADCNSPLFPPFPQALIAALLLEVFARHGVGGVSPLGGGWDELQALLVDLFGGFLFTKNFKKNSPGGICCLHLRFEWFKRNMFVYRSISMKRQTGSVGAGAVKCAVFYGRFPQHLCITSLHI